VQERSYDIVQTDVLVIGAGAAGMRSAIAAAENGSRVIVATKGQAARSGATPMACPSYQAALALEDDRDSPEIAFEDTCFEGRYLGDEDIILTLTSEATERARDLIRYGVRFKKKDEGTFIQVVHPGHSFARNLVIMGNGYAMASGLRRELLKKSSIQLFEDVVVSKVLTNEFGVTGAVALNMRSGEVIVFEARAIVIATGGYQELWLWTDTEPGLTGDGVWLGYQAGADLVDLEMMLFYPTGLCHPPEIEGTLVQYEGLMTPQYCAGVMTNGLGEEFLPETDRLPVRDVMMKLMFLEIEAGRGTRHGGVNIELSKSPKSSREILEILNKLDSLPYNNLSEFGINVLEEPIEVRPVTHYTLGGIRINPQCETTVPGLFAAGEVSGNVHGANRTSGNALAETMVFGARAGKSAANFAQSQTLQKVDRDEIKREVARLESFLIPKRHSLRPIDLKRKIKAIMDEYVNYRRDAQGLIHSIEELQRMRCEDLPRIQVVSGPRIYNIEWEEAIEASNMVGLAELVAASALMRQESRGHHWRTDFPSMERSWEKHTIATREGDGYKIKTAPVVRIKDRTKERRKPDPELIAAGVLDDNV